METGGKEPCSTSFIHSSMGGQHSALMVTYGEGRRTTAILARDGPGTQSSVGTFWRERRQEKWSDQETITLLSRKPQGKCDVFSVSSTV